jgi:hypothetical protein
MYAPSNAGTKHLERQRQRQIPGGNDKKKSKNKGEGSLMVKVSCVGRGLWRRGVYRNALGRCPSHPNRFRRIVHYSFHLNIVQTAPSPEGTEQETTEGIRWTFLIMTHWRVRQRAAPDRTTGGSVEAGWPIATQQRYPVQTHTRLLQATQIGNKSCR